MSEAVKLYIAKYRPCLFRDEPRNIGCIVELNGVRLAKFKTARQAKSKYPAAYRQWIDYWRRNIDDDILKLSGKAMNFYIASGGEIHDTGDDPLSDVLAFAYEMYVK